MSLGFARPVFSSILHRVGTYKEDVTENKEAAYFLHI